MRKILAIIFGFASAASLLHRSRAQLYPDDLPEHLRYVAEPDVVEYEPPKELSETLPYYLSGFDFDNRPIWVIEFGKWDLRTYLEKGEKWEKLLDKYIDKLIWRLYDSAKIKATEEHPVKDGVLIVDFEGLAYRQFSSPLALSFYIKRVASVVSALPLVHDVFAVNASFSSRNLLELLRPIIGREFHRVEIYGTNPSSFKSVLLKIVPKDQIPEWYGGDKDFKPLKVYG